MSTTPVPIGRTAVHGGGRARAVVLDEDAASQTIGQLSALLGLAFGLVAFAYEPLLFGAVGITLGLVGKHSGTGLGRVTVGVAMLATILGPTFGSVVYAALLGG